MFNAFEHVEGNMYVPSRLALDGSYMGVAWFPLVFSKTRCCPMLPTADESAGSMER